MSQTGQKKRRTSHSSGLLIDTFASPIEHHKARSSLISLLDPVREFNALMPMLRIPTTVNFGGCQDYGKHKSDV